MKCLSTARAAGIALAVLFAGRVDAAVVTHRDGDLDTSYAASATTPAVSGRGLYPIVSANGGMDVAKTIILHPDHSLLLVGQGVDDSAPVGGVLNVDASGAPVQGTFCHFRFESCELNEGYTVALGSSTLGISSPYARDLFVAGIHPLSDTTSDVALQFVAPDYDQSTPATALHASIANGTSQQTLTAFGQQPDGKLLFVGYQVNAGNTAIFVFRANANLSVDGTFGNGGTAVIGPTLFPLNSHYDYEANAFVLNPDGSLIVIGTIRGDITDFNSYVGIFKLTSSGALDTTFGANHNGRVALDFSGGAFAQQRSTGNAIALRDDGSVLVGGSVYAPAQTGNPTAQTYAAVARIHADGSYGDWFGEDNRFTVTDNSYGVQASSSVLFHYSNLATNLVDSVNAISVQPNGRILLAGAAGIGRQKYFGISRLERNGGPDLTFGAIAKESTRYYAYLCGEFPSSNTCSADPADEAFAVASDSSGIYVAGASRSTVGTSEMGYTRLLNRDAIFADGFGSLPPGG